MKEAVSRTALAVTLWRARESSRSAASRLFEDGLAPVFLDRRFRWALRLSRLPLIGAMVPWSLIDGHWAGSRGTVAVRTRYIDDALAAALRNGVEQVVILGAGFDSRAYRVPGIDRIRVFEVDHPATQTEKKKVIARRLGALPSHVEFVPIDFSTHTLDAMLPAAGFRAATRTFFICEGVTHYLSAADVDTLFRYVARSGAAGSEMVFTYIHRTILDGTATFAGREDSGDRSAVRRTVHVRLRSGRAPSVSRGPRPGADRRRRSQHVSRALPRPGSAAGASRSPSSSGLRACELPGRAAA